MVEILVRQKRSSVSWDFLTDRQLNLTPSKNPRARHRLERGEKFAREEIIDFYQETVREISKLIPKGSISVEVYSDHSTLAEDNVEDRQREMFSWIPNAHIKFPTSQEGLEGSGAGSQEWHANQHDPLFYSNRRLRSTQPPEVRKRGDVYLSPFIGRLDDRGENGMDVISHILKMYRKGMAMSWS